MLITRKTKSTMASLMFITWNNKSTLHGTLNLHWCLVFITWNTKSTMEYLVFITWNT